MQKWFIWICDILFPPHEETLHVRRMVPSDIEALYRVETTGTFTALSHFKNPSVRALIHEAKFRGNRKAHRMLGALCDLYISAHAREYVIIPIPLSKARKRTRGYNQVEEALRFSVHALPHLNTEVLIRSRNTTPQTELSKLERLTNLKDAFLVQDPTAVQGKHILLIDDVTTTGATLSEAKSALLIHHPASITCLAFAH